ncbi:zinc metallochaperone AztD [Arthrobacter sp.]|uniref:zinc metallochaperone AztD n=1 Tax=Arthrobacter sp. TaxID=1667 RepID=UPI003A8DAD60
MIDTPPQTIPPATTPGCDRQPRRIRSFRNGLRGSPQAIIGPLAALLVLSGCGAGSPGADAADATPPAAPTEAAAATPRLVATYDGGVMVLDAATGDIVLDEPLAGFNRLNAAGDGRHVLVSTSGGFRALDAGAWSVPHGDHDHHYTAPPALTDHLFPATEPGHVVHHGGHTVLFDDDTGRATGFDPAGLAEGMPATRQDQAPAAHHGLAVELEDGTLLMTSGTADSRTGITASGPAGPSGQRTEVARSGQCPGVHGAAIAAGEAVAFGCEDGMLVYRQGRLAKVQAPTAYGRVGNQAGSDASAVVLGDYKSDPDADLERPTRVSLTNTATGAMELVETGTSYSFRSLGRTPEGGALVLGTDGRLRLIDPDSGKTTESVAVTRPWKEPREWQQPRPSLAVQDDIAYVSEPGTRTVHLVDLDSMESLVSYRLPHTPNELAAIPG